MSMTCEIVNGLNILICMIYIRFIILPVTMDFVWIFYTCFLNIVGIRVSRTSSLANHRGKLAFLIMVNTFGFIQKIAIIYHLKKIFHVFIM